MPSNTLTMMNALIKAATTASTTFQSIAARKSVIDADQPPATSTVAGMAALSIAGAGAGDTCTIGCGVFQSRISLIRGWPRLSGEKQTPGGQRPLTRT